MRRLVLLALIAAACTPAAASPADQCHAELDARHVAWKPAARPGIAIAVEITGPLGGVTFKAPSPKSPLVIDCSLAVSLAEAGRYLTALGVDHAGWISAYSVRNVRGTNHRSKHSYGLAIDVARFGGTAIGELSVEPDFEQGLGDSVDCLGQPATQAGAILAVAKCQLVRSGLFFLVLTPDYDDAHHDHFHLEALPWTERASLRSDKPAIH